MNLPNKLTVFRMILVIPFVILLLQDFTMAAAVVFAIAALTDAVDGFIARKTKQVTDFGKLMDPLADKVLVISALLLFVQFQYVPAWMIILILTREFFVVGIRTLVSAKGEVMPAMLSGKLKTVAQMIAILAIIFTAQSYLSWWIMFVVTAITLWSGIEYGWKNREYFRESK